MNFDSLKDQVSNLTLYDLKAGVRKVQNGKPLELRLGCTARHDAYGAVSSGHELHRDGSKGTVS